MNSPISQILISLIFSGEIIASQMSESLNIIINTSSTLSYVKYEPLMSGNSVFTFKNEKNQLIMVKTVYAREDSKLIFVSFQLGVDEFYEKYEMPESIGENYHKLMLMILSININAIEKKSDQSALLQLRKKYQSQNKTIKTPK